MSDPKVLSTDSSRDRLGAWAVRAILLWFYTALACSVAGVFDTRHGPPIPLGVAALLPVVAFIVGYLRWPAFREMVLHANLRMLTLAQTWRVMAVTFLVLYSQRVLPGAFAIPAGLGDIAIGATAPFISWAIFSRDVFPKRLFVLWNVLGLVDLVTAVSLGILASASPIGVLAGDVTTQAMGRFPLSLIPTFFVPLLAIFHLMSLLRMSKAPRLGDQGAE
jgi:hypothetical protein